MKIDRKRAIRHAERLLLEAAVDAQQWNRAIEAVADACSSGSGQIISLGSQRQITLNLLTGAPAGTAKLAEAYGLGDPVLNPRLRAGLKMPLMTPVVDEDYIDAGGRKRSSIYGEFFGPQGFWFNCQAAVLRRDDMLVRVAINRARHERPFDGEDLKAFSELLPCVRAAVRVQVALSEARTAGLTQAFDAAATAAVLLGTSGQLVGISVAGEQLLRDGLYLTTRNGRLEATCEAGRIAFATRLAKVLSCEAVTRSFAQDSMVLHSREGLSRISVEFHPLPRERSLFDSGAALMLLFKPVSDDKQRIETLRKHFQLTPGEAAVAMLLAQGLSPARIAAQRGVSIATIRSQVQSVYTKLDVRRQTELVNVIAKLV